MNRTPNSADILPGPGFRIGNSQERPSGEIIRRLAAFDAPTISDALNRLYALDSGIQCLTRADRMAGPVCTVSVYPGDNLMVHKVLDLAKPGDVVMINSRGSTGVSLNAVLGDMICTKARHRGITGFVVDGLVRDLPGILELDMPVFARGTTAIGPLHRGPGEINFPIACGGVVVNAGDVVIADPAGIVVIPQGFAAELAGRLEERADQARSYVESVARGDFSNEWVDDLLQRAGCYVDGQSPRAGESDQS